MNKRFQRGEIATILAVGALVVLGITAVVTSVVVQKNKQTTKIKAADVSGGFCEDPNYLSPPDFLCNEGYSTGEYFLDLNQYCCIKNQTGSSTAPQPSTCTGQSTGKTGECIIDSPSECTGFYNYIKDGACGSNKICCIPVSQPASPSFTCAPPEVLRYWSCNDNEIPTKNDVNYEFTGNICCKPSQSTNTNPPSDLYWYFDKSWNGCVKVTDRFDDKAHCERDLASWARSNTTVASNITLTPTCYTSLDSCKVANPPPVAPPAPPAQPVFSCQPGEKEIPMAEYSKKDGVGCGFNYSLSNYNIELEKVCCKPNPQSAPAQPVQPVPVAPPPAAVQPVPPVQQPPAQPVQPVNLPIPAPQIPINCPNKSRGDANCDSNINDLDYNEWRSEYLGQKQTRNADFDTSGKVDLVDFEIWRRNQKD